ncbi:MAG: 30S ribosomal protein S18 [Candidatus Omnitrophica bacterium]|nr:30S ribosomal protein S18 [Candidatus Omnitrophota bacterium]
MGGGRPGGGFEERGGRPFRKKINRFYTVFTERSNEIDYKDTEKLLRFLTEKGKIIPRRITGFTAKQQRMLARAIKRARYAGLLPFQAD